MGEPSSPTPIDEPAGPVVRRRRRRIVRHHVREKTPEPSARGEPTLHYSDEDDDVDGGSGDGVTTVTSSAAIASKTGGNEASDKHHQRGSSHRSKILSLRDRGVGPSASFRSQSSPRVADELTANTGNVDGDSAAGGGVGMLLRQVKRSLSSPRHPEELIRRHYERDSRVPAREIPDKPARSPVPVVRTPSTAEGGRELTKLERNLRRFEEERRRFEEEKRRFEQEKKDAETAARNRRLQAFARKRAEREQDEQTDKDVTQKLYSILRVIEDNKHHLPSILKAEASGEVWKTSSEEDQPRPSGPSKKPETAVKLEVLEFPDESSVEVGDDYESSTAKSSSSREGDFDDEECVTVVEDLSKAHKKTELNMPDQSTEATVDTQPKRSLLAAFFGRPASPTVNVNDLPAPPPMKPSTGPVSLRRFIFVETRLVWHQLLHDRRDDWQTAKRCRNRCFADLVIMMIVCGIGGLMFRFVEGSFENFYKCGVRRVKRDFVDNLWTTSHNLREDDWKTMARAKLRAFEEELHAAHEAGMTSYSGMKAWTFVNGMIYCLTVITTIGYGHIYPATNTGRAITIVYSLVGIPMFMILLADFGKYFTWRIKFGLAFVRRLGNTSSFGRIFKQYYVQRTIRVINKIYSFLLVQRNSIAIKNDPDFKCSTLDLSVNPTAPTATATEDGFLAAFAIDDEFDLPICLAMAILFGYIFCGAVAFAVLEDWSLFEAAYFVFVSMSTIGFGDYVPKSSVNMLGSIVYLVFGLALTSMCITVVQNRLNDGFRKVSTRIGTTLGMSMDVVLGGASGDAGSRQRVRRLKTRSTSKVK